MAPLAPRGSTVSPDWAPQSCIALGWPSRDDVWRNEAMPARSAIVSFIIKLVTHAGERIILVANADDDQAVSSARVAVSAISAPVGRVEVLALPIDDCWMRDISPVFLTGSFGVTPLCFRFNAWGGANGGCYNSFERDAAFAQRLCNKLKLGDRARLVNFVLEGGSISCDGAGTLLTTEECLLSPNRNPGMSRHEVQDILCTTLGVSKVIWLPFGAPGDSDTDGHVDNFAVFIAPATVLLASPAPGQKTSKEAQIRSDAARAVLNESTDAQGRPITVHTVRFPPSLTRSKEEAAGVRQIPGTKARPSDEILAASYVNLVQTTLAVFVPSFGIPECDAAALTEIEEAFEGSGKQIVQVEAREFILAGGGLHCMSANIPAAPPK